MTDTLANGAAVPGPEGDGAGAPGGYGAGAPGGDGAGAPGESGTSEALALASVALSVVGFLTLLRLADRRDRSPAKALGLFLATTTESTLGTALGAVAIQRSRQVDRMNRGFLLAIAGTVLGVITTVMNVNWMRTKRHL